MRSRKRGQDSLAADTLAAALARGDAPVLRAFLDAGGNVETSRKVSRGHVVVGGISLLMDASALGHRDVVELLLQRGANVDRQSSHGDTALISAAAAGRAAIVHQLVSVGAQLGLRNCLGQSALQLAERHRHVDCVRAFREGLHALAASRQALAASSEAERVLGGTITNGKLALSPAGASCAAVSRLGKAAASPSRLPLHMIAATGRGDVAAIAAWLDGGGEVEAERQSSDGEVRGLTMLMDASAQGHVYLIDLLLRHHASVNRQDSNGVSALMFASSCGRPRVIARLLRAGARIGTRSANGRTALQAANERGHDECVRLLLAVRRQSEPRRRHLHSKMDGLRDRGDGLSKVVDVADGVVASDVAADVASEAVGCAVAAAFEQVVPLGSDDDLELASSDDEEEEEEEALAAAVRQKKSGRGSSSVVMVSSEVAATVARAIAVEAVAAACV